MMLELCEADLIRGWKDICTALGGVSEDTAMRLANRLRDPLPVWHDWRGPFMWRTGHREWEIRQRLPHQVHTRELRRHTGKRGE